MKFGKLVSEKRSLFMTPAILAAGTGIVSLANDRSLLSTMSTLTDGREMVTLHLSPGTGFRSVESQRGEAVELRISPASPWPTAESHRSAGISSYPNVVEEVLPVGTRFSTMTFGSRGHSPFSLSIPRGSRRIITYTSQARSSIGQGYMEMTQSRRGSRLGNSVRKVVTTSVTGRPSVWIGRISGSGRGRGMVGESFQGDLGGYSSKQVIFQAPYDRGGRIKVMTDTPGATLTNYDNDYGVDGCSTSYSAQGGVITTCVRRRRVIVHPSIFRAGRSLSSIQASSGRLSGMVGYKLDISGDQQTRPRGNMRITVTPVTSRAS